MNADDQSLIERFLDHEPEAAATIQHWIQQATFRFRPALGHDWEDAQQDILLDTLMLLQNRAFRGDSRLRTYLSRVAENACKDRLRKTRRWQWVDNGFDQTVIEVLHRQGYLVEDNRTKLTALNLMQRVVEAMPKECQQLWWMIYCGLTYKEMATRTEVAAGTLRVRVLRCRRGAIAKLKELDPAGES